MIRLAAAVVLLAVSNGRWILPLAAWFGPALLLLFVRSRPPRIGLSLGFAAQFAAFSWSWRGLIPVPDPWYSVVTATYAAVYFAPFALDRWLAPRLPPLRSTLVLPTAGVAIELVFQRFLSPYGTWASLAYTQVDRLPLLQLASGTGVAGIHFVMLWFAAVLAGAWSNRGTGAPIARLAGVFAAVMLAVGLHGELRIRLAPQDVDSIRVAGLTPSARLTTELRRAMAEPGPAGDAEDAGRERARLAARINADLLVRTRAEVRAGAEVVVWSEHAAAVTPETEPLLVAEARTIAAESGATIVMGVGVWRPGERPPFENKAVIVSASGEHDGDYFKAKPIVGRETGLVARGDPAPRVLESSGERFALVLCHDLDFPPFVSEAGRQEVVALLAPSADWDAITPLHARMAIVRAVENGCSLVRPCEGGLSLAVDPLGRTLAAQRDVGPDGQAMICHVPRFRLAAPYSGGGDAFAGACVLGLLALSASARWPRSRRSTVDRRSNRPYLAR